MWWQDVSGTKWVFFFFFSKFFCEHTRLLDLRPPASSPSIPVVTGVFPRGCCRGAVGRTRHLSSAYSPSFYPFPVVSRQSLQTPIRHSCHIRSFCRSESVWRSVDLDLLVGPRWGCQSARRYIFILSLSSYPTPVLPPTSTFILAGSSTPVPRLRSGCACHIRPGTVVGPWGRVVDSTYPD